VVDVGLTAVNIVIAVVTVFVIAYYWMVERASLKRTVLQVAGAKHARRVNTLWVAIEARLGAWVRGQLLLMLSVGGGLGIGYVLLGLPGAFALALWAAVAELIPMLGPYIGVAPALVVALTISPTTALILMIYAVVIQSIEGYVLVPRVMGHAVGISPLVVFLGILVGVTLGGLPGGFIAVPIAGALQVILQDLLAPSSELTERAQEAGANIDNSGQTPKPIPPHAHAVLPGGELAPDASGTGIPGTPVGSGSGRT
jgi:predicted PurR-regulated permease PerM